MQVFLGKFYIVPVKGDGRAENRNLCLSIHHICINLLVPSVKKINIGNPGIKVNYWGGGGGGGGGVNPPPPH